MFKNTFFTEQLWWLLLITLPLLLQAIYDLCLKVRKTNWLVSIWREFRVILVVSGFRLKHKYHQKLSWWRPLPYRNQSIDLLCKPLDLFLHDRDLRYERVKGNAQFLFLGSHQKSGSSKALSALPWIIQNLLTTHSFHWLEPITVILSFLKNI